MNHPSQTELLAYAGRTIDDRRGAQLDLHLTECERCRNAARAMAAVEGALHRLPPERPSAAFTRGVLSRIGIRETTPLWWLFFRNFAPILAAAAVAGFIMTLGNGGGNAGARPTSGNPLFDAGLVGTALRDGLDAFTAWTGGLVSKLHADHVGTDSVRLTLFIACLFAGLGLLDRFVLGPRLRRKN